MKQQCPLCDSEKCKIQGMKSGNNTKEITCEICGNFYATSFFLHYYKQNKKTYLLQGAIYEKNMSGQKVMLFWEKPPKEAKEANNKIEIASYTIEELLDSVNAPTTPIEKIDKLLVNLSKLEDEDGFARIFDLILDRDYPFAYARNAKELQFLLATMEKEYSYIEGVSVIDLEEVSLMGQREHLILEENTASSSRLSVSFKLSVKAWERIYQTQKTNIESKQGFVASWFDDSHDKYRLAIKRGIKKAGYDAESIKDRKFGNTIIEKAFGEIRKSKFVIVDLTKHRSAVLVEWGFAMGLGIETILVMSEENRIQKEKDLGGIDFYAKNFQILFYSTTIELENKVHNAIAARIGENK